MASSEEEMTVKWKGKDYTVRICGDDTIGKLKGRIRQMTNVLPKHQKLLYPKISPSMFTNDSTLLSQLSLKPSRKKMTMIGTVEDDIVVDQVDFSVLNEHKLRTCIDRYKIDLRNPCREGKKLLVLDIDYTLYDNSNRKGNPLNYMRPYLHELLTSAYTQYDIMMWSATSMRWTQMKLKQLGILDNPNYKITAILDYLAMILVESEVDLGSIIDCKPLKVIWEQLPEFYSKKNTIMIDDIETNFHMNPWNGLTIREFKKGRSIQSNDQELVKLNQYLLKIAEFEDISCLGHRDWESLC